MQYTLAKMFSIKNTALIISKCLKNSFYLKNKNEKQLKKTRI